jgi:hypothetical protein
MKPQGALLQVHSSVSGELNSVHIILTWGHFMILFSSLDPAPFLLVNSEHMNLCK